MKKTIFEVLKRRDRLYQYKVGKNEDLTLVLLSHGDANNHVTVKLVKTGARVNIIGLVVGKKEDKLDLHTLQLHCAPDTVSNLLVKSILYDQAQFNYDGAIRVERFAQKTDAYQRNENLLLSGEAHVQTKPALEILANDVYCTHAATVGRVSQEQVWYLRSRGIRPETAQILIAEGFMESAINQISDTMVQNKARRKLWQILSK